MLQLCRKFFMLHYIYLLSKCLKLNSHLTCISLLLKIILIETVKNMMFYVKYDFLHK